MPRPKVTEELRRRIATACLHCKEIKQKCDGRTPCAPCNRRGLSAACAYSVIPRSYGARRQRRKKRIVEDEPRQTPRTSSPNASQPTTFTEQTDQTLQNVVSNNSSQLHSSPVGIDVAIPKLSRTMYDTKGKVCKSEECPNRLNVITV